MPDRQHEALLQECRDLFRDRLLEAVRGTLDGVAESLQTMADKTSNFEVRTRYLDARELAVKHRDVIEAQFRRKLMSEFQDRVDKADGELDMTGGGLSLDDLQLVDDDMLNETLKFNDMAQKMRRHCDAEMSALDQRAAVLLGKPKVEADDNPFGAKVVADSFKHACQQVECPMEVRLVFMKSFETLALDGILSTCREVNDLLVANQILPKIRFAVTKNESKLPKPGEPGAQPEVAAAAEPAAAPQEDMFAMIARSLGGQMPQAPAAPGMGMGGAPLLEGANLMGSLSSLQRGDASVLGAAAAELAPLLAEAGNLQNVLRKLKDTSVGQGMGQMDAMTLEIVSMLFDALFDDPKISLAVKGLIGRLQLPMLKVAIASKELFSSKAHPARLFLDAMGQLGLRLPRELPADHPTYKKLEGHVDGLVHNFQESLDVFDVARAEVEAMIAAEDKEVSARMETSQKELEQVERLALAKSEVQDDLRARVAAHPSVAHEVFEFLATQWIKYLVVVRAKDGADSPAWKAASEVTEKLLWSVEPKPTPEDAKALTKSIPMLIKGIRTGVAAGGIEDTVSQAFMQKLMELHASAVRAQPPPPAPVKGKDGKEAKPIARGPQPELDFTKPMTLDNPFGGGKVEVSDDDLDFTVAITPASAPAAAGAASPHATGSMPAVSAAGEGAKPAKPTRPAQKVRLPTKMEVGIWVTVEDEGAHTKRPARLHYVSPLKSHFLFVDRQGNKVFECSRTMLARRLKLGEVVMLDGEPDASLFDRIMEGIFGKLKKPMPGQPAHAPTAAPA